MVRRGALMDPAAGFLLLAQSTVARLAGTTNGQTLGPSQADTVAAPWQDLFAHADARCGGRVALE